MMQHNIDKTWTLFIDRDGVINHEKKEDYILNWSEFIFYDNTKDAMKIFANTFGTIILVTNQRGVGIQKMNVEDLENIHKNMLQEIENAGGRIDKIYYCADIDNTSPNRKPNAGMAFKAKKDFPNINFEKSFIVGNRLSDMQFGRNAGIKTVYLNTTNPEIENPHSLIDYRFNSLIEFANSL